MESTPFDWLEKLFTWKSTMCAWWAHVVLSLSLSHYNNLSHMSGFDITHHILRLLTEIFKLEKYYHPDSQLWYRATISCGKEITRVHLSDHFTRCYSFTARTYLLSSIACGTIRRWLLYKTSRWRGGALSTLSIISRVISYNKTLLLLASAKQIDISLSHS